MTALLDERLRDLATQNELGDLEAILQSIANEEKELRGRR